MSRWARLAAHGVIDGPVVTAHVEVGAQVSAQGAAGSGVCEEPDDATLVARAVRGDGRAEEAIYKRYVRYVAAIAIHLTGSRQEAEDIVQDTFEKALDQLSSLRDGAALRPWLAQITLRQVHRRARRRRLMRLFGLDGSAQDATLDTLASPSASPEVRAELSRVQSVIALANDDARAAWTLHKVEGETLEYTSEVCRCSLATTKRRVAAVESLLRARLRKEER